MFACNRCSKRTSRQFLRMWQTLCLRKAWKWTGLVSSFFQTDDRRLDHCRNGSREHRARILLERRPFHVAAAGVFDCVGYDYDFAMLSFATLKNHAANNRA